MSAKAYLAQAERNRKVAATLASKGDPASLQWAVTCLFYAGLHYVNAYHCAYVKSPLPSRHGARRNNVSRYMKPIATAYSWLKDHSEQARYDLICPNQATVKLALCKVVAIQRYVSGSTVPRTATRSEAP